MILIGVAVAALTFTSTASADRVFTADDFGDPNGTPCLPDPSPFTTCSLRQAISAARTPGDEPVIKLLPGTYTLSLEEGAGGVDDNLNGDLDWADLGPDQLADLRIEGAGSGLTTIQAASSVKDRVIEFFSANVAVSMTGVTLKGGRPITTNDGLTGGGLQNAMTGPLSLQDVRIVDNATLTIAGDGHGGGIYSIGDYLALDQVALTNNHSSGWGGAIALNDGLGLTPTLQITNSTIDGNGTDVYPTADIMGGGAIANFGDGAGGNADPVLTVTNSTIDSNRALGFGGAIDTFGGATTNLESTTVTRNVANSDGSGGQAGGGLQNGGATISVKNSLIALNSVGAGGFNPNCSGSFGSLGGNVLGDLTGCAGFNAAGDISTANPLVGPLSANGGPTATVPLLAGSPAIDHTSNCPAADQRGTARPQAAACDTGAFELVPTAPAPATTPQKKKCKKKKGKKRASVAKKKKCKKKRRK